MTELHTGDTLDHYQIEKLVARSGMASIFRASDEQSGQPVASKFLIRRLRPIPCFTIASVGNRKSVKSSITLG